MYGCFVDYLALLNPTTGVKNALERSVLYNLCQQRARKSCNQKNLIPAS